MNTPTPRLPHAVLDLSSRHWKAQKIEHLLELHLTEGSLRMLEVGTGVGGISHYFGTHTSKRFMVESVDVTDSRQVREGYHFTLVQDTHLPFPNGTFDVVISNHVIEHVGDLQAQRHHLAELHRVMAPGGVGYLSVPNRWMLVEPHFQLAFLSWLPRPWRSPYVRLRQRGQLYDCEPLQLHELDRLLEQAGFEWSHLEAQAVQALFHTEPTHSLLTRMARHLPEWAFAALRPGIPTLICKLTHRTPRFGRPHV